MNKQNRLWFDYQKYNRLINDDYRKHPLFSWGLFTPILIGHMAFIFTSFIWTYFTGVLNGPLNLGAYLTLLIISHIIIYYLIRNYNTWFYKITQNSA